MSNIYLFRAVGHQDVWIDMDKKEMIRSGAEPVRFLNLGIFRKMVDYLENVYGHPPMEVDEIPVNQPQTLPQ